jgi:hypothetical protein
MNTNIAYTIICIKKFLVIKDDGIALGSDVWIIHEYTTPRPPNPNDVVIIVNTNITVPFQQLY